MLNRLVSNFVLGFFVVVLVVVYGVAKQVPAYQIKQPVQKTNTVASSRTDSDSTRATVAGIATKKVDGRAVVTLPNGTTVSAIVADTDASRQQGLSGTEPLGAGEGMLFVFEKADDYGIWMKEMKYDLDIIWMDENGRVVHLVEEAKAPATASENLTVYKNTDPALYVLEIPAGSAGKAGVGLGTILSIS